MLKKLVIGAVAAVSSLGVVAALPATPVEAHHGTRCVARANKTPFPQRAWARCSGPRRGWMQLNFVCYKVVWVIENGVVVDKQFFFTAREGPVRFKPRRAIRYSRGVCPSTHPFVATQFGLQPRVVTWH